MASTKTNKIEKRTPLPRLTFKVIQLCCLVKKDSFTPKVLKLHFVSVKHGSASIWYIAHSTFDIEAESCLTVTNYNFRTFRVKESFWAKQQSCITLKVSLGCGVRFSILFVLVDAILLSLDLQKRTSEQINFFDFSILKNIISIKYAKIGNILFFWGFF